MSKAKRTAKVKASTGVAEHLAAKALAALSGTGKKLSTCVLSCFNALIVSGCHLASSFFRQSQFSPSPLPLDYEEIEFV